MATRLTVKAVENAVAGSSRREIPDGLLQGLYLVVQPSGAKSWAIRYRHNDRPKKLTLGKVLILAKGQAEPEPTLGGHLTLAGARQLGRDCLTLVAAGRDPAKERQEEKQERRDERRLFENVARLFIERHAKPKNRSWAETARLLGLVPDPKATEPKEKRALVLHEAGVAVEWKNRRIDDITRRDVVELLDAIVDRGAGAAANNTLAAVRKLFNWCVERGLLEASPAAGVSAPAPSKTRDRVLDDEELLAVWKASDKLGHPFGPLVKLLILTGQRREEVAGIRWSEIDIEGKVWTIPRERMKKDREQVVPLSDPALEIILSLKEKRIAGCDLMLSTNGRTAPSGFSKAKKALDQQAADILARPLPHWVYHDFRRTMASGMARLGINLPIIEKILAHESGSFGGVVGVYQRHQFIDERRFALKAWGEFVTGLGVEKADNVVALKAAP